MNQTFAQLFVITHSYANLRKPVSALLAQHVELLEWVRQRCQHLQRQQALQDFLNSPVAHAKYFSHTT